MLSRRLVDPLPADPTRSFDTVGAVLSALGLILVVLGILAADDNVWLMLGLLVAGALVLAGFFVWVRHKERAGQEPLLSTSLFRNRTSNLGLVTQNVQWLLLLGVSFTVSAYLQVVRGYDAIQTGVIFTAATAGLLLSSLGAERFAKRRAQRTLILVGFVVTIAGIGVLLALVAGTPTAWAFAPGLFLIGFGLGGMLTPSVNLVQSSFAEDAAGRDLRPVPQRVEPRLLARHRDRRHHPRRRPHRERVRRGDGDAGRHRPDRARRRGAPPGPDGASGSVRAQHAGGPHKPVIA